MEIDINEYEELKMRIMDLEEENKSLREENSRVAQLVGKFAIPFVKAGLSAEDFDCIFDGMNEVEYTITDDIGSLRKLLFLKIKFEEVRGRI